MPIRHSISPEQLIGQFIAGGSARGIYAERFYLKRRLRRLRRLFGRRQQLHSRLCAAHDRRAARRYRRQWWEDLA